VVRTAPGLEYARVASCHLDRTQAEAAARALWSERYFHPAIYVGLAEEWAVAGRIVSLSRDLTGAGHVRDPRREYPVSTGRGKGY
jgi:hypothetical protein